MSIPPLVRRVLLTVLVGYIVLFGATYDGILDAPRRLISILVLCALVGVWIVSRWRGGWRWHSTPLDTAMLLWGAAFALSLITNFDAARRILIGVWFMALYVGAWYALQDALANGALRREWLIDALLIAGVPVLFIGYAQVLVNGIAVRPGSLMGNANTLAALLILLLPFALGRLRMVRSPLARVLLTVHAVAALALIALTGSRGGWLGAAAALVVWIVLSFPLRRIWASVPRNGKIVIAAAFVLGAAAGVFVLAQTFGIGGRGLDYREFIYSSALRMFSERPLGGSGLFTFGAGLSRLNSMPPVEPHAHAHNVILNAAAEMGIVGLAALALTAWVALRAVRRANNPIAIMGVAAFSGFVAHQMFDLPAMLPAIALVALVVLVLLLPANEKPLPRSLRARLTPILLGIGGVVLAMTGVWNALSYGAYVSALSAGVTGGDLRAAGDRLQPLIDADPALAVYWQQQGMLYALAGEGSLGLAQRDFERYTRLEPTYVSGWANLAAIYSQLQQDEAAADAMREAASLAQDSWQIMYRYGVYVEAIGETDAARQIYQKAISIHQDTPMLPDWNQSPIRTALFDESKLSPVARTLLALERGDAATAHDIWNGFADREYPNSSYYVISEMLALSEGDADRASIALAQADRVAFDRNTRAWVNVGMAFMADFDTYIDAARARLDPGAFGRDWELGANINYIQYLSLALERQFLPQVGYIEADPTLLHLLGSPDALANIRAAVAG